MFHSSKRFWLACLLFAVAGVRPAFGFALIGPLNETFQAPIIGYGLQPNSSSLGNDGGNVDAGAPKNIGQGYRWNLPTLFYACDSTFESYFGSNGVAAVDAAYFVLNSLTNVSSYSSNLSEWPQNTSQYNYTAQDLDLIDVKSTTLSLMMEQLGLAQPDRWVWCLHDRFTGGGLVCPNYAYTVIQRNYDPILSPTNYSTFVNGTLYDYQIAELCLLNPNGFAPLEADAIEFTPDPTTEYTALAAFGAQDIPGTYYTGLTYDDIGGLRYLYSATNKFVEQASANSQLLFTNQPSQLLITSNLELFTQQALTNPPVALLGLYPTLAITSFTNFFTNVVTTNIEAFYVTNAAFPYIFEEPSIVLITNLTTNVVTMYSYTFGNVVTNHYYTNGFVVTQTTNATPNPFAPILITNEFSQLLASSDLALLTQQALTNPPAAFEALYPNILVTGYTNFFTNVVTTNIEAFYVTNPAPPFTNNSPSLVLITNLTTNVVTEYNYTFANVVTNHFHSNNIVITQVTNAAVNPFAPILVTNQFAQLLSTSNLFQLSQDSLTNDPTALQALYPNLVINGWTNIFTNLATPHPFAYFTNPPLGVAGEPPILVQGTNYTTNVAILFNYFFGNVVTNHHYTNGYITTQVTNIEVQLGVAGGPLVTNVTTKTVLTNKYVLTTNGNNINGDYYIVPTNLWGYDIILTQLVSVIPITNIVLSATNALNVTNLTGQSFTENFINYFTNYNYIVYPIVAFPGPVQTNVTSVTNFGGNISGDYYVIPTNLFGYDILSTQLVSVVATTNIIVTATNGPGVTATNLNFTMDVITFATNYDYVVYPIQGFAGPVQTNVVSVTNIDNFVNGDFYIVPPGLYGYDILSTQLVTVVATTNLIVFATNGPGVTATNLNFTEQVITFSTNYTLVEYPIQYVPNSVALREGCEKINYIRRDFDSLLGTYWAPITNFYQLTAVTNGVPFIQNFRRVVTQPDIVFSAADLASGPSAIPVVGGIARTAPLNFNTSQVPGGQGGPGTLVPPISFTFDEVGPAFFNSGPFSFIINGGLSGLPGSGSANSSFVFLWASFDGSTNAPIIYPDTTSLASLESQVFFQVLGTLLPVGSVSGNGAATPYSAQLQAQGASPPFNWAMAPNSSGLPNGLSLSASGVISGTLTGAIVGTYDFQVQATDADGRVSQTQLFIEVDP